MNFLMDDELIQELVILTGKVTRANQSCVLGETNTRELKGRPIVRLQEAREHTSRFEFSLPSSLYKW
jgi:hypothetical protein